MQTSEIIRTRRLALGLSQAELAAAVGMEVRQIGRYETGASQPSLHAARAIAERLDISLDELAGEALNLSGPWWSMWQGMESQHLQLQVQLLHRGKRLEMGPASEPTDPVHEHQPRVRGELRIVDDEMLGWYVMEGNRRGRGTMTLQKKDDGLVGVWLTANLKDGVTDGYVALARTQEAVTSLIHGLVQDRPTRHDKTK